MISLLKMPKLSPTMELGTLVKWHKQDGDAVTSGDVLIEVSTDKAVVEHTATDDGWILQRLVKEGDKVQVGAPIAVFSTEQNAAFDLEELLPKPEKEADERPLEQPEQESKSSSPSGSNLSILGVKPEPPLPHPLSFKEPGCISPVSPLAKRLAKERRLDLSNVQGSGPGGRIIERDLEKAPTKGIAGFGFPESSDIHPGSYKEEALSPIREVISQRLQSAKMTVPHFYVKQKIIATPLVDMLKQLKQQNIKVSVNDCIVRACALALKEFPEVNSGFNSVDNKIIRFQTIDISVAVSIPDGIITPIVRCADKKNVGMISAEIKNLAKKAKTQSLKEHEYKGGSFCVSNLGMTGITEFSAIINPPQSAILAVGGIEEQPIIVNNQITIGATCVLTLSVDHRVIDGFPAALFLKRLQQLLESPAVLLLN